MKSSNAPNLGIADNSCGQSAEQHLKLQPFIRVREVISSQPAGWTIWANMPVEMKQRLFMPFWSESRLRRHLEMLKAFGFNSIQVTSPAAALWIGADYRGWRERQLFLLKTARGLGMSTSVFVWGAAVVDPAVGGQCVVELDWHKPEDRARLEAWYRDEAEFAPFVDRVITHWIDPGYNSHFCKDCTIDTVVEMHNFIMGIFREKTPKVHGALSTWFMQDPLSIWRQPDMRWPGYESAGKLAAHPKLDKDTDIVMGLNNEEADGNTGAGIGVLKVADLEGIAAAGRQAGVWCWYTADIEINPALHVRTKVMQNYFRNLPPQTHTGLDWHSLDDNFPGLNMQNLYVAGKLMQDPSLDANKLLEEFVTGFAGEANAPAVTAALRAVEEARTRSLLYSRVEDSVAPPTKSGNNRKPLPATWLADTAKAVDAAIVGMRTVKLAPNFKTAWPVTMEPKEYLPELVAHLEAIRQMLMFLQGVSEVARLHAAGAPADKLKAAITALPKVTYDPAHTAGLEAAIYAQKLAELNKRVAGK